eukprot:UN09869
MYMNVVSNVLMSKPAHTHEKNEVNIISFRTRQRNLDETLVTIFRMIFNIFFDENTRDIVFCATFLQTAAIEKTLFDHDIFV